MGRTRLPVSSRRAERHRAGLGFGATLSVAGHVTLLVAAIAAGERFATPPPPVEEPLAFVELIQQDTPVVSDPASAAPSLQPTPETAPANAAKPAPAAPSEDNPALQPTPDETAGELAPTAPPVPIPPPPATRPPTPQPEIATAPVRLGDEDAPAGTGLVFGSQVLPASPDTKIYNRPPAYPREAARRGEQGSVELIIHIAPDGTARTVEIAESSGSAELDRSAREAVLSWRFRPAIRDGMPIASVLPFRVKFTIGGQESGFTEGR
jgi:protein TonB